MSVEEACFSRLMSHTFSQSLSLSNMGVYVLFALNQLGRMTSPSSRPPYSSSPLSIFKPRHRHPRQIVTAVVCLFPDTTNLLGAGGAIECPLMSGQR